MARSFPVKMVWFAIVGMCLSAIAAAQTQAAAGSDDEEAAYTRTIFARAQRIVDTLDLPDTSKAERVRDLIAGQYRDLRKIHDARDAKLAGPGPGADRAIAEAWAGVIRNRADMEIFHLHRRFVAELAGELSPAQVDKVKDGMTYGVVPITYRRYLQLFPELTDAQKATVLGDLIEAREYAMDAGSSEEKHGWFRKYKGRINNYLSRAGYDMKQAERDLAERERESASAKAP